MDALRQFALFLLFSAVVMGAVTFVLPHGRLTETAKSVLTVTVFFAVLQFLPAFRLRLPVPASAGGYDADDFSAAAEVAGAAAERLMNGVLAERLRTVTNAPYTASFALHIDGDMRIDLQRLEIVFPSGGADAENVETAVRELFGEAVEVKIEVRP